MRTKKVIISLSILTILTLCLLNVAAASTSTSITAPHSKVVADATTLQPTNITITDYPKQVKVGEDFNITGRLTSGNTGLGNKLVYLEQLNTTENKWYWYWNFTTNADGSFTDSFHYNVPGTFYVSYVFFGDAQYAFCASDVMKITAVS
jgi:hypothetical protein